MKKTMTAILALALLMALFCGQALAASGDITIKSVKAYSDSSMKNYVGTIPAYTAVLVRSYDSYADVYVGGKLVYINKYALLRDDVTSNYMATLKKGTRVYQQADTSAKDIKLTDDGDVLVCFIDGDWALVQTTGKLGLYGFVKTDKLTQIRTR